MIVITNRTFRYLKRISKKPLMLHDVPDCDRYIITEAINNGLIKDYPILIDPQGDDIPENQATKLELLPKGKNELDSLNSEFRYRVLTIFLMVAAIVTTVLVGLFL